MTGRGQKVSELRPHRPRSRADQITIQPKVDQMTERRNFPLSQVTDIPILQINEMIFRKKDRQVFANDRLGDIPCRNHRHYLDTFH
jgi:hypothetical protein